jgi:hypothetical protein
MARGRCTFKQQDVTRALRATVAAGLAVQRVEIDKGGRIIVVTGKPDGEITEDRGGANEWDKIK